MEQIIHASENNSSKTKEEIFNDLFPDNIPKEDVAYCRQSTHTAIVPVRYAVDEKDCDGHKECSHLGDPLKLESRHLVFRQLRNGWVYLYDSTNKKVYEYELVQDIYKIEKNTEHLYIEVINNITFELFYSPIRFSERMRKQIQISTKKGEIPDIFRLNTQLKSINLKNYCSNGIPRIPKRDNGLNLDNTIETFSNATPNQLSMYSHNAKTHFETSLSNKDLSGSEKNIIKELLPLLNDAIGNVISETPAPSEMLKQQIIAKLKELKSYENTGGYDYYGSFPIKELSYYVSDITTDESYSERLFLDTSYALQKGINDDYTKSITNPQYIINDLSDNVKNSLINMGTIIGDPLGIISDLIFNLQIASSELSVFEYDNKYAIAIANPCFSVAYPSSSAIYRGLGDDMHPYYNNIRLYKPNNSEQQKNQEMLTDGEPLEFLKTWEQKQHYVYLCEKDLIKFLDNYCEKQTNLSFASSFGFDCLEKEHFYKLVDIFSNAYTCLCKTSYGRKWLQQELKDPKNIGLLLFGFNRDLFEQLKVLQTDFLGLITGKIKLKDEAKETFKMLASIIKDENFPNIKEIFAHVAECISVTMSEAPQAKSKIIFKDNSEKVRSISNYINILTAITGELKTVKGTQDFNTSMANWLKNNSVNLNTLRSLNYKIHYGSIRGIATKDWEKTRNAFISELEIKSNKPKLSKLTPLESKLGFSRIISSLTVLLETQELIFIIDRIKSQQIITGEDTLTIATNVITFSSTILSIKLATLESQNIVFLKNNSNLSRLINQRTPAPQIEKLTKLEQNIRNLDKGLYLLNTINDWYNVTNATTYRERAILTDNAIITSTLLLMALCEIELSTGVGAAIAALQIYLISQAEKEKRTDTQIWLEHCFFGKKRGLLKSKDIWGWSNPYDELISLYKILNRPNVQTQHNTIGTPTKISRPKEPPIYKHIIKSVSIYIDYPKLLKGEYIYIEIYTDTYSEYFYFPLNYIVKKSNSSYQIDIPINHSLNKKVIGMDISIGDSIDSVSPKNTSFSYNLGIFLDAFETYDEKAPQKKSIPIANEDDFLHKLNHVKHQAVEKGMVIFSDEYSVK